MAFPHAPSSLELRSLCLLLSLALRISASPCPCVRPPIVGRLPDLCHLAMPRARIIWIPTQGSVASPMRVMDACWPLAPPKSPTPPRLPCRAPRSHQKVCFRIMPCSSSHVFLASAVLPFPASTKVGGHSRMNPRGRGFGMGPTPLSHPGVHSGC